MLFEPLIAFTGAAFEAGPVDNPDGAAAALNQPFLLERSHYRVDARALDSEQASEGFLGELDPVAGTVLGVEQPARRPLGDRVEGVARCRLHYSCEEAIGKAAEDVGNEGRAALGVFERLHRHAENGAADQDDRAREGRRVAAADDPADSAFTAD